MVFANIGDILEISSSQKDALEIVGQFSSDLENNHNNIVLKALNAYRKINPNTIPNGIKIKLKKNLPIASGIGGGSADCAATLRGLNKLSTKKLEPNKLNKLAFSLGADVPVCLSSTPSIMRNIGEEIEPIKNFPNIYIILINPLLEISTKDIFSQLEKVNNSPIPPYDNAFNNIKNLAIWLKKTRNDLIKPATKTTPIIKEIIDELYKDKNCQYASMSGSGATVFGLFSTLNEAEKAAKKINSKWQNSWISYAKLASNNS